MASRSSSFPAAVLRSRESPAGDRIVQLLCSAGIVDAFAFGGPKSKLRSLASPWHSGTAWIYEDKARGLVKLTDFDADEEFPRIRTDLSAIGAASLAAEFIMASDALGGDGEFSRVLFVELLRALDRAEHGIPDAALPQFCLRALRAMGVMPDARECASCAGEIGPRTVHSYSRRLGGFLCERCAFHAEGPDPLLDLPAGAMAYIARSEAMEFGEAARAGLSVPALAALRACTLDLIAKAAHGRLRSLESGLL